MARVRSDAETGGATVWYDDEVRQPANASDVAAALWDLVVLDGPQRAGVWHLPGPESLTRHELARRAASALGLHPGTITSGPSPVPAARPRHLHLLGERARSGIGWAPGEVLPPRRSGQSTCGSPVIS